MVGQRNRDENRFKFIPFSERINNINVDIFHRVPHRNEESELDRKSNLQEAHDKWIVLNRSKEWMELQKLIVADGVKTLAQVLNQRKKLVQLFCEHLPLQTEHSIEPVLGLLTALVKDLRLEFYPFYRQIQNHLIELIRSRIPVKIEHAFVCLAYIFKYLDRSMVKNLPIVLADLAGLLNHDMPVYIQNFAAESFAFVARRVKNKDKLINVILETVKKNTAMLDGCASLLVETMRGVKDQLHSSSRDTLTALFIKFLDNKKSHKVLDAFTNVMVKIYLEKINPKSSNIVEELASVIKSMDRRSITSARSLLKILTSVIAYKGGVHAGNGYIVYELIIMLKDIIEVREYLRQLSTMLIKMHTLSQDVTARLIQTVHNSDEDLIFSFVEDVCEYSGFEAMILPDVLSRWNQANKKIVSTLSKVVAVKISKQLEWTKYYLPVHSSIAQDVLSSLQDTRTLSFEQLASHIFLLPHISSIPQQSASEALTKLLDVTVTELTEKGKLKEKLIVLYLALESLNSFEEHIIGKGLAGEIYKNVIPFANESFIAFKSLEGLLKLVVKSDEASLLSMSELREAAIRRLTSPRHKSRLSALKVLQMLVQLGQLDISCSEALDVCVSAEIVPLTVQTYREATVYIRELHFQTASLNLDDDTIQIPFRFLLGYVHSNFSLIDADVASAIQSYDQSKNMLLWTIFKEQLSIESAEEENLNDLELPVHLKQWLESRTECSGRLDFNKHKERLWKILQKYALEESQEKDVIDFTLNYSQSKTLCRYWTNTCNIRHRADDSNDGKEVDLDENQPALNFSKRLLGYQLDIVTKTRSHCSIKYRVEEVKKLCMDLLLDGDCSLRKSALESLIASTPKSLTPYRKQLLDLIDDDGFKAAIVHFQLDKDKGEVKETHRPVVMPLVLRLLYSKMVSSAPTQRGNKSSAAAHRRKQVMSFLAACQEKEMANFLAMAFSGFNIDPEGISSSSAIEAKMNQVLLEEVTHPKKLQSAVNLTFVMLEYLGGHLSDKLQKFLLHVLLSVCATVSAILSKRDEVLSGFLPTLKKIRGTCLKALALFFNKFTRFPWVEDDVRALFTVVVWPLADKLSTEGIHSPTPLMKLFAVWSQHPRYFVLLARHLDGDTTKTPLTFLMDLLLNDQCQQTVPTAIAAILERLLTLREEVPMEVDDEAPLSALDIHCVRPIDDETLSKLNVKEELNFGSKIILPHVADILEFLRKQLARNDKRVLSSSETTVLARVTELATSPEHGDALIGLLFRVLYGKIPSDEEVLVNSLLTIRNLLIIVSKPLTYVRSLAVLFGNIEPVQGRKVLVTCVEELSSRCPEFGELTDIVKDLNAYDRRWVDQCDFNKRLDTLKLIRLKAADNTLSLDVALFVIHTSFFFLRTEKDLSIRDSTELCLKEICPKLLITVDGNIGEKEYLTETILKAILGGIQGKDDRFKGSVIGLLGVLARESAASHFVLQDLSLFTNKSDLEVDLFENIHHLQLYRRNRALLKMTSILRSLKKPINIRTVTQFLMPLASQFLCCEAYAGKNSLVDAAIECVGVICRLLPWYQYQALLKHFLLKLRTQVEYQRQCVRIVIAILDSFHFDISRAKEVATEVVEDAGTDIEVDGGKATEEGNEVVIDILEEIIDAVVLEHGGDTNIEEEEVKDSKEETLVVETITVLKPPAAKRVHRAISGHLLEQLYKAIGQRTAVESSHKLNRKSLGPDKDEEDILRVPIAVTLVKLLQKLPGDLLETQLPGIFMKLCTFLKSHLESVRRVTRETLQQIMTSLGPSKLPLLLGELTSLLTKGFQVHVLVFTINTVIQTLQPLLQPGDIDSNLPTILQVCSADLFGLASEEKEVFRIKVKHKEVRSPKSFNLLHLVSQFVTDKCLTDLLLPIKQALSQKNSHKIMVKCRECLRQIVLGLAMNKFIPIESLLVFLYGAASESIPQLQPTAPPPPKKHNPKVRQDCLLLAPEPSSRASSAPVKNNARSGAHLVVEFGLHLLMLLLKRDNFKKMELASYLDPLVPILKAALESQHVKVSTLSVKCLTRIVTTDLPNLRAYIIPITASLFSFLHKFAAAGLSKGDNFDLVLAVFKIVSVIVRDVGYHTLTQEQLRALLLYAEQDIHDSSRQAVAFGLIKSVLHRKLNTPELHSVLLRVATLSITSTVEHVRVQARQTMLHYIMDYPLGKKLEDILGFFLAQLNYDLESGRKSALEMLFSLINAFPTKMLREQSGLLFVTLGARLVNDDSPDCKKTIAAVIKGLLVHLGPKDRNGLFDMLILWLQQEKMIHRRLAVQMAGLFVSLEKGGFAVRLPVLLPLIQKQLTGNEEPGKFVRLPSAKNEEERLLDHHLYQVLVLLVKICVHCPVLLTDENYRQPVSILAEMAHNLLCHDHEWVRVGAAQFLGSVFSSLKPIKLAAALNGESGEAGDIRFWDSLTFTDKIRSLILDHTAQFVPGVELSQDFTDQLMKNLVYFAKVLKDVKPEKKVGCNKKAEDGVDTHSKQSPSLRWLIRRMRRIVNLEVARTPSCHVLRSAVFLWTGAVAVCLTKEELLPELYNLAAPLMREIDIAQGEALLSTIAALAADVISKLKKKVGVDEFTELSVKLHIRLMEKRTKRKSAQAQEFVTDPERAVKRKMERQVKKNESKKRKKERVRGKKKYKGKKKNVKSSLEN